MRSKLDYFDFITLLSDIQNAINSRPLTYVSSENDCVPLTPNSFLKLHGGSGLELRTDDDPDDPTFSLEPLTHRDLNKN